VLRSARRARLCQAVEEVTNSTCLHLASTSRTSFTPAHRAAHRPASSPVASFLN
jgi:hypothetical protein